MLREVDREEWEGQRSQTLPRSLQSISLQQSKVDLNDVWSNFCYSLLKALHKVPLRCTVDVEPMNTVAEV